MEEKDPDSDKLGKRRDLNDVGEGLSWTIKKQNFNFFGFLARNDFFARVPNPSRASREGGNMMLGN